MFELISFILGLAILGLVVGVGRGLWWIFFRAFPWIATEGPEAFAFIIPVLFLACLGLEHLGAAILKHVRG